MKMVIENDVGSGIRNIGLGLAYKFLRGSNFRPGIYQWAEEFKIQTNLTEKAQPIVEKLDTNGKKEPIF
ncbi:hypothetical protein SLA2020_215310 [Shorea laevis]